MAYRKRRTRRRRRRNTKKSGKRLIRLIKAVAFKTQETKTYSDYFEPFNMLPPSILSLHQYSVVIPLFFDIPTIKNTLTRSGESVVGEKLYSKGISMKMALWQNDTALGGVSSIAGRITLLSTTHGSDINVVGSSPRIPGYVPDIWREPSGNPYVTTRWNLQRVRVLKTKRFGIRPNGGLSYASFINFFCPVKGWKTRDTRETINPLVTDYFGNLSGRNYFVALEMWTVNGEPVNNTCQMTIDKKYWFKDA